MWTVLVRISLKRSPCDSRPAPVYSDLFRLFLYYTASMAVPALFRAMMLEK
jgi:hypothetical protein